MFGVDISTIAKFTLHFATINTSACSLLVFNSMTFTLHFATINTTVLEGKRLAEIIFTLHFATINTIQSNIYSLFR